MSGLAGLRAPDLAAIEALARDAYAALPQEFRASCGGLAIHVDDFPDDETLAGMGCESEFDPLGLFRGVGPAQGGRGRHGADRGGRRRTLNAGAAKRIDRRRSVL